MLTLEEKTLSGMDFNSLLAVMVRASGKSWEQAGRECGWSPAVTNRIRDDVEGEYTPGAIKMADFCAATGSDLYPRWIVARMKAATGAASPSSAPEALDCVDLVERTAALFKEVGEFGQKAHRAVADGNLGSKEISSLERDLFDLLALGLDLLPRLESSR